MPPINYTRMRRKLTATILLIFLASAVSASSFGTVPSENSKNVTNDRGNFYIDVMNLGNQPLDVQVEAFNVDEDASIRLSMPQGAESSFDSFILNPSIVTDSPDDTGKWFLVEKDRYVETSRIGITAIRTGEKKKIDFDIRVTASTFSDTEEETENVKPSQNVVQVREYSFDMTASDRSNTQSNETLVDRARRIGSEVGRQVAESVDRFNPANSPSATPSTGSGSVTSSSSGSDSDQETDVTVNERDNQETGSESSNTESAPVGTRESSTEEEDIDSQGAKNQESVGSFTEQINSMTYVLGLALVVSAAYIVKVM